MWHFLLCFMLVAAASTRSSESGGLRTEAYLIVQHPDHLLVYNQYQQRITTGERLLFTPFIPMHIVDLHATLSDNYTPCVKIRLGDDIFYLLTNGQKTLLSSASLGYVRLFNHVKSLEDTVRIIHPTGVDFLSPDKLHEDKLLHGGVAVRYFQYEGMIYGQVLDNQQHCGWIDQSVATEKYTVSAKSSEHEELSKKIRDRIGGKIREVNSALKSLFLYFCAQSNQQKIIPQWHIAMSDHAIACTLEPANYANSFPESDEYLLRDLENLIIGTNLGVRSIPGKIEIYVK